VEEERIQFNSDFMKADLVKLGRRTTVVPPIMRTGQTQGQIPITPNRILGINNRRTSSSADTKN